MKMKRLCALAVLLTSSLAGADNGVADLEGQYYAGLNFGAGWGGGFKMKPSVVFGYHHDKNSKFELEVLSNISNIASTNRVIGASLLANYRFYPDLDIDPVKLYVSGGLGGYLQIVPFGFGGADTSTSNRDVGTQTGEKDVGTQTDGTGVGTQTNETDVGTQTDEIDVGTQTDEIDVETQTDEIDVETQTDEGSSKPAGSSIADKILGSISYKLKVGVDYEITPQIVGSVGIAVGGQLSGLKAAKIPDATLEVGVRYNF